jgi:ribosomal protein S12 methylthiotransferase accessory factor
MHDTPLWLDDSVTHVVFGDGRALLVGDEATTLFDTPGVLDVLRLLDGHRTARDVATILSDRQAPEVTHFILLAMARASLVRQEGRRPMEASSSRAVPEASADLSEVLSAAWSSRAGLDVVSVPLTDETALVLTDDYLNPRIVEVVQAGLRRRGAKLILARIGTRRVWIGPSYGVAPSACIQCLRERLRVNLVGDAMVHLGASLPAGVTVERLNRAIPSAAFRLLALHASTVAGSLETVADAIQVIELRSTSPVVETHRIMRQPGCAACGDPALQSPGALVSLVSRPKIDGVDGGYRVLDSTGTLHRLTPHVSPLTGVIRHVRKVPVGDGDVVHTYTASHPREFGPPTFRAVRADRRDPAGGKGRTDIDARISAMCESVERYSAAHRGTELHRVARLSELHDRAIHPAQLLLFSRRQYDMRQEWNTVNVDTFHWIPEPYDDEPVEWSPVRSLVTGEERCIPSAFLYHGFRGKGRRFCRADSNGLSSGNVIEEAILQGLLELVERDAVATWWYNRLRLPELDLSSSDDPYIAEATSFYERLGRGLWVLALPTDLAIPCFAAVSARHAHPADVIFGFGAHLDRDIALSRAVTELNQVLPTVMRSREDRREQMLPAFAAAIEWWESATFETEEYLWPSLGPSRQLASFEKPERSDLLDDVHDCVDRLARAGCDVLVHDLTRPEVDFPVVRVIAPGLRHFWRRLAPGRLYDLPVALGMLASPRREEELNPISMFM